MKKIFLVITGLWMGSVFPMGPGRPQSAPIPISFNFTTIQRFVDKTLVIVSNALRHLTDVTDILISTNNIAQGTPQNTASIKILKHKIAQIQKAAQQISLLNSQLNNPNADRLHVTAQLLKMVEETIGYIKEVLTIIKNNESWYLLL